VPDSVALVLSTTGFNCKGMANWLSVNNCNVAPLDRYRVGHTPHRHAALERKRSLLNVHVAEIGVPHGWGRCDGLAAVEVQLTRAGLDELVAVADEAGIGSAAVRMPKNASARMTVFEVSVTGATRRSGQPSYDQRPIAVGAAAATTMDWIPGALPARSSVAPFLHGHSRGVRAKCS